MDSPKKPTSIWFPIAKAGAIGARLKSLKSPIMPRRQYNDVFPPPSWEIDKLVIDSNNGWDKTSFESPSKTPKTPTGEEDVVQPDETAVPTEVPVDPEPDGPEPLTLAQRIRDLIESLPLPGGLTPFKQPVNNDESEPEGLKATDGSTGPPVPQGVDQELVLMLSSEEVMNGDEGEQGKEGIERQSVWSILSDMRWKGKGKEKEDTETDVELPVSPSPNNTHDGLMMYAPLEPTNDSEVELAEVRSISNVSSPPGSPILEQPPEDVKWVPSTTEISIYTTWWGYRLYLPPSAMATLDSASFKATTQAAMITGALKWLLDKVPNMLVPVQFRPALNLMKRLSPVVGYIGVFVAWSWGRIKKHDKGNGVILTATWLLPVALIPMAWDAGDIFTPLLLPKPEDRVPPPSQNVDKEQSKGKKKRFWQY